jgi:hypothetical protein
MDTYITAHFFDQYVVIKVTSAPEYYVVAVCGSYTDAAAIAAALN